MALFAGTVNVVGYVSAGETYVVYDDAGLPTGGSIEQPLPRPFDVRDPDAYALVVVGDSMGKIAPAGSRVIVSPNAEVRSGDIAIVRTKDEKALIKEVTFSGDKVRLNSFGNHEEILADKEDVVFIHKVVWVRRP
ncbi:MAG: S24 family peptidase [Candidatus Brocadiales bacterium]